MSTNAAAEMQEREWTNKIRDEFSACCRANADLLGDIKKESAGETLQNEFVA